MCRLTESPLLPSPPGVCEGTGEVFSSLLRFSRRSNLPLGRSGSVQPELALCLVYGLHMKTAIISQVNYISGHLEEGSHSPAYS